jgi:hypothetical protein
MGNNRGAGSYIQQSYVSSVKYNKDGQPEKETYKTQMIRQTDKDGKRIQETQQAYQNSQTGIEKASHERLLNDRGHKVVKQRNRNQGEELEHNYFKGIGENDLQQFENEYNDYRGKVKFQDNYKALEGMNRRINSNLALSGNNNNTTSTTTNNYRRPPQNALPNDSRRSKF